jgi:hypothetical protein
MFEPILIDKALYLPAPDVEALAEGRVVAAIPRVSIEEGWSFILYPGHPSTHALPVERQYNLDFLPIAKSALGQLENSTIQIRTWARCESCVLIYEPEQLNILSHLTAWTPIALKKILQQQQHFFLACLRVYKIPKPIEVSKGHFGSEKVGKFISLSALGLPDHAPIPLKIDTVLPVLSDGIFNQRKQQVTERKLPLHPDLENLHDAIAQLAKNNPNAKELEKDIKVFLCWADHSATNQLESDLTWIKTIVGLGNRSKELDEGKNNWQAGTDFENVVHQSLEFLGFTVDEAHKGGAGGLDLFCSKPYPLVGECKAGKGIPSRTTEELIKLGGMRLGKDRFLASAKLIIGPGNPTSDVLTAAQEWRVSIINPMSLQKLVELKAKYPGSIDLIELKKYLEPGQIDHKIDEYIDKVIAEIRLRAHITQILKNHLERVRATDVDLNTLFGVYCGSSPSQVLTTQEFYKVLIELSSPLTGYLGRRKGNDGRDRFYFLRHMPEVDQDSDE